MDDLVVEVLGELVPRPVRRGELRRDGRALRWVETGAGSPAVVLDVFSPVREDYAELSNKYIPTRQSD